MYTFYVKSGEVMVVSKYNERYPENFIVFESLDARCTCKMAVAYLVQCRHEICLHSNQFKFILFDKRYHYRMKPTMVPRNAHRDDYYPPDSDIIEEARRVSELIENRKLVRTNKVFNSNMNDVVGINEQETHNHMQSIDMDSEDIQNITSSKVTRHFLIVKANECVNSVCSIGIDKYNTSLLVVFDKITKLVKNGVNVTVQSFSNQAQNLLAIFQHDFGSDRIISTALDPQPLNNRFLRKQAQSRLKSSSENSRAGTQRKKTSSGKSNCSLCSVSDHVITKCPYRTLHGDEIRDMDDFIRKITSVYHCASAGQINNNDIPSLLKSHSVKHFKVHTVNSQVGEIRCTSDIMELNLLVSGLDKECRNVNPLYEKVTVSANEFVNYIRSTIPTGHRSSRTKYVFDNIQKESQGERFVSRRNLATQSNSIIGSPWNIGDTFNPPLPGPVVMYATGLQPPPLSQQMSILSAVTFSKTWNEYHECTSTPRR